MSSRSLAAARARRAGENAPPISGNRPGTSIGSYAQQQMMPSPSPNVRVARNLPQQQQQNNYQQPQQQQQTQNGLPFNKLSISDAIGLITLRLGRVEQWIIETDHENSENNNSNVSYGELPENSRIVDNSVLNTFVNRLDSLEKKESNESIIKLSEDVKNLNEHLNKIVEESSKHSLITAKHTEQLFRFERELVETKDILKTFMLKYDMFTNETNEKLSDFEYAITELEKNIPDSLEETENSSTNKNIEDDPNNDVDQNSETTDNNELSSILSVDLKNIVKQELASESI
jgi:hypothetical protein